MELKIKLSLNFADSGVSVSGRRRTRLLFRFIVPAVLDFFLIFSSVRRNTQKFRNGNWFLFAKIRPRRKTITTRLYCTSIRDVYRSKIRKNKFTNDRLVIIGLSRSAPEIGRIAKRLQSKSRRFRIWALKKWPLNGPGSDKTRDLKNPFGFDRLTR